MDIRIEADYDAQSQIGSYGLIILIGVFQCISTTSATRTTTAATSKDQYSYSRGRLRGDALERHWDGLGVDLETTAPRVLAKSMAKAWHRLGDNVDLDFPVEVVVGASASTVSPNLNNEMVRFQLFYEDVDASSACLEVALESHCKLDEATYRMILCNLEPAARRTNEGEDLNFNVIQFEEEFLQHCHERAKPSPATATCEPQVRETSVFSDPLKTILSLPAARQPSAGHPKRGGVRSLGGNRRKKARTLAYAKDD